MQGLLREGDKLKIPRAVKEPSPERERAVKEPRAPSLERERAVTTEKASQRAVKESRAPSLERERAVTTKMALQISPPNLLQYQ